MVPRTGITVPPNCNYGNPACETYFVLYSSWGETAGFPSDGGFEEWKVKVYPPAVGTTATSAQDWLPNDTATITSAGGQALNGTLTIQLYTGGTCAAGSEVAGQLYTFPLANEASGTAHTHEQHDVQGHCERARSRGSLPSRAPIPTPSRAARTASRLP